MTAELLADLDPELAAEHLAIPYASSVVVTLAFSRADVVPLDGYGYLVPRAEGRDVLACTWSSQKWEGRAPDDCVLLGSTPDGSAGAILTEDADADLVALAREEVAFLGRRLRSRSSSAYTAGHSGCRSTSSGIRSGSRGSTQRFAAHPGLALAGAAYRGVGIPDCIHSGRARRRVGRPRARRSTGVSRERSERLYAEALDLLPGGVSSPVRAFRAVGGSPLFVERGEGAYLVDVDGNRYVDYVLSWGPLILGHAHPRVVAALEEALRKGTSFGAPSPLELELARLIQDAMPSLELVRFVSSGTEATMSALRVARAFTGRRRSSSSSAATTGTRTSFSCRPARASRRSGCRTRRA